MSERKAAAESMKLDRPWMPGDNNNPPMVPGDATDDAAYMKQHDIQLKLATALARTIRNKPEKPLAFIASLISPETNVYPDSTAAAAAEGNKTE